MTDTKTLDEHVAVILAKLKQSESEALARLKVGDEVRYTGEDRRYIMQGEKRYMTQGNTYTVLGFAESRAVITTSDFEGVRGYVRATKLEPVV